MLDVYVDFNTAQTDPAGRVTLAEDGSCRVDDAAVIAALRALVPPGGRITVSDEALCVEATVVHEGRVWYGVPEWDTGRENATREGGHSRTALTAPQWHTMI